MAYKLILGLIIFFIAFISFFITLFLSNNKKMPFRKRAFFPKIFNQNIAEALACGIFLGAGLLHLFPDALKHTSSQNDYPTMFLIVGVVFLFLLLLEHLANKHYNNRKINNISIYLTVFLLMCHSFFTGIALGSEKQSTIVFVVFLAIIAHKWAAAFAIAIQTSEYHLTVWQTWAIGLLFSLSTPIGLLCGEFFFVNVSSFMIGIIDAIAAGTFIFIGTLHGLYNSVLIKDCCNFRNFLFVIVGFSIMSIIAIWA